MRAVETECTEDRLTLNQFDECKPEFDENDAEFVLTSSSEMFNLLLNLTTGEANATVRRCQGLGWLAWKRLTSSLNPRTLASGIKAISAVLAPGKIQQATKADHEVDSWEDRMAKLSTEYGQILSAKMKVAVLYTMLPKDLQEKVLDECAVNWDETPEAEAGVLFTKIKGHIKNIAKSRREMSGPRPMEVDAVSKGYKWSEWHDSHGYRDFDSVDEHEEKTDEEEAYVQFIGKGGKKGTGKGFQGYCYVCGEFGHSQWDCNKGKGKGKGWSKGKGGYGKEGSYGKSHGKDSFYSKGSGKDGYYGKGEQGKAWMQKACFGCGSTEHLLKDCPKNPKIQNVEDEAPEVLFIGNVQNRKEEEWKRIPMKVQLGDFMRVLVKRPTSTQKAKNRFKVLQVDEDDCEGGRDEVLHIRTVEDLGSSAEQHDQARVLKFGGRAQRAREAEENMDNYWATMRDEQYVQMVGENNKKGEWVSLGVGDIIIDSAADESCWPVGQGDAFPTLPSNRKMVLKTANGGDMEHYGQKEILFRCNSGEGKEPIGLTFQVTDVKKPLLAVRRLVERGNKVVLAAGDGESYIYSDWSKTKVPVKKKGGSFVIEAHFVKQTGVSGFARQA